LLSAAPEHGFPWLLLQGENELEQVEQELSNSNSSGSKRNLTGEDEKKQSKALTRLLYMLFSPVFLKAFTLTFLAEWGDRSQIATIG
jgi:putative Ca2+/H+ antiporter (TMEM165/GDT1 family)